MTAMIIAFPRAAAPRRARADALTEPTPPLPKIAVPLLCGLAAAGLAAAGSFWLAGAVSPRAIVTAGLLVFGNAGWAMRGQPLSPPDAGIAWPGGDCL